MGNNTSEVFCCKGRRGLDGWLSGEAKEDAEGGQVSYFEYTADQSEVDIERGVILSSALKNSEKDAKQEAQFLARAEDGVNFAEKDFFLDESDRSILSMKMMLSDKKANEKK